MYSLMKTNEVQKMLQSHGDLLSVTQTNTPIQPASASANLNNRNSHNNQQNTNNKNLERKTTNNSKKNNTMVYNNSHKQQNGPRSGMGNSGGGGGGGQRSVFSSSNNSKNIHNHHHNQNQNNHKSHHHHQNNKYDNSNYYAISSGMDSSSNNSNHTKRRKSINYNNNGIKKRYQQLYHHHNNQNNQNNNNQNSHNNHKGLPNGPPLEPSINPESHQVPSISVKSIEELPEQTIKIPPNTSFSDNQQNAIDFKNESKSDCSDNNSLEKTLCERQVSLVKSDLKQVKLEEHDHVVVPEKSDEIKPKVKEETPPGDCVKPDNTDRNEIKITDVDMKKESSISDSVKKSPKSPGGQTQYPNEFLKIIREKMHVKENSLISLLNTITGSYIMKNNKPNGPQMMSPNVPNPPFSGDQNQHQQQQNLHHQNLNVLNNNAATNYELLANVILNNGNIMTNFNHLTEPLAGGPFNNMGRRIQNTRHNSNDFFYQKPANHMPFVNNNYQQQPPMNSNMNGAGVNHFHRMNGYNASGNMRFQNHYHQNNYGFNNYQFHNNNQNHYNNGSYPNTGRPKNFWNFCMNCKRNQFCQIHMNNVNSSNNNNMHHGNYHHHYSYSNQNGYQNQHQNHNPNNGNNANNQKDKKNNRHNHNNSIKGRNYNQQNLQMNQHMKFNLESRSNASSCPGSPQLHSPKSEISLETGSTSSSPPPQGDHKSDGLNSKKQFNNYNLKKGNRRQNQFFGNGYESDSSSYSGNLNIETQFYPQQQYFPNQHLQYHPGGDMNTNVNPNNDELNLISRCNYGLLQNLKLWNTNNAVRHHLLVRGDLETNQVMSPTNHRNMPLSTSPMTLDLPQQSPLENQPNENGASQTWSSLFVPNSRDVNINEAQTIKPQKDEPDEEEEKKKLMSPVPSTHTSPIHTPADKFLANAHLIETKDCPKNLVMNSEVPNIWETLSQQIWTTFLLIQQTEDTYKKKIVLWKTLYIAIKKAFPKLSLYLVGSTITGFGAETSDVDMCVVSKMTPGHDPRGDALVTLTDIKNHLLANSRNFNDFNLITAKVPILRFKDAINMIEVDLNHNNCVGIRNTHLLYCYSRLDWRVRPLVLLVKLWAKFHDINNAKNMTISSYSLVLMVIHFLQCAVSPPVLPCLHSMYPDKFQISPYSIMRDVSSVDMNEDVESPFVSQNTEPLGELMLQFLFYYSNFDYSQYAISVRTGTCLLIEDCRLVRAPKNDIHQWKNLCIEEPFDYTNTARAVYDVDVFEKIKYVFVQSYNHLQQTLNLESILSTKFVTFLPFLLESAAHAHHQHHHHPPPHDNSNLNLYTAPPTMATTGPQ